MKDTVGEGGCMEVMTSSFFFPILWCLITATSITVEEKNPPFPNQSTSSLIRGGKVKITTTATKEEKEGRGMCGRGRGNFHKINACGLEDSLIWRRH
uniref:Uncharacterized protein n=1 Tax=Trypanosoma brucei TaxID=5691 RepID=Q583B3_9TRYP|nr:hypothetical protein, unlikely [Trypanosoma brucei]